MITSLRKRFIRTGMASVIIVLLLILAAVNLLNYRSYLEESDRRLTMIENAGGSLNGIRSGDGNTPPEKPPGDSQMAEAPYDTRYFSAELDKQKEIISLNMTDIASIKESEAEQMISDVTSGDRTNGRMGAFRYRIKKTDASHYLIIFLNVSRELSSVRSFLSASVLAGAAGIAAVFVLMHFLTKLAMAPAETAFEKQKKFITDASHEIKTPLAIIESNVEVLEMDTGENKWITNIRNQVRRLSSLTEKLVLLSRMDESGYRTALSSFDLAELLRSVSSEYQGRPVTIDAPDFLPYYGSRENISRLISMLLDNAMKYTTEGGCVSVTLSGSPRQYSRIRRHGYTLSLKNPCDTLPAGNLDYLFDRFSRLDSSRSKKNGGSGIGLAVVAGIAAFHKGEAHASSPDGRTFQIMVKL